MTEVRSFPAPKTKMNDMPVWCHHHCLKMTLVEASEHKIVICSDENPSSAAASIVIERVFGHDELFSIQYQLRHSDSSVTGRIEMRSEFLRSAFGVADIVGESSAWLLENFGGDAAHQGSFIRYKNYLNIPGPGTGHDGDANISARIDEKMTTVIDMFTQSTPKLF